MPSACASNTSTDKFRHTANFRDPTGETVRHMVGPEGTPSRNPLGLPVAQRVVRPVIL
jgi:hypothetical protein